MERNVVARIISWRKAFLLALLVALAALFPAQAHAADVSSAAELRTALAAGGDIKLMGNITGGPFTVAEGITATIDLNGYTIDRNLSSAARDGNVIQVNGTLTVTDTSPGQDGRITGGWNSYGFSGGVWVQENASFTLEGGSITGNVAAGINGYGGGVLVDIGATFTMRGGEISYCSAGSDGSTSEGIGGGVAVSGTFTMTGGYIYECGILNDKLSSTAYGGAVAVVEGGTFVLDGGTIGADADGNLYGNQANQQGGAVYVQKRADNALDTSAANTFEFKSGIITVSSASGGAAGAVYDGDTFTMTGGTIEQTPSGPAVVVDSNGTFDMSSGAIQNNSATGVVVNSGGTFTMTGGGISENTGAFGGGVRVNGGEFNLSGGAIVDNTANSAGGGVYISPDNSEYGLVNGGTFNMTSGTIAQNIVTGFNNSASVGYGNGGGIWVGKGTFNLSGGIIVNNQSALVTTDGGHASLGGGVWVENTGTFTVTGEPAIQDNKVGSSSFISNVKLDSNARISVDGNLNNARIGVTPFVSVGSDWGNNAVDIFQFAQGANDNVFSNAAVSEDTLRNFSSDVEDYKVVLHDGDNYAQLLYHAHTITYTAEGNKLTAECTGCDEKAELILFAEGGVDDGFVQPAYFGSPGLTAINELTKKSISQNDIEYYKGDTKLDAMPTEVGTYTARFTLTEDGTDYTIEQEFTIDHEWDEGTVTQEPTIDAEGVMTYKCKHFDTCGGTKTESIPKLVPITLTLIGSSIDGEEVVEDLVLELAPGTTLRDVYDDSKEDIIDHFTVEGYFPYAKEVFLMSKPLNQFTTWNGVVVEDEGIDYDEALTEDTALYLALAKPVEAIKLTVEKPLCGTEVEYNSPDDKKGQPVLSASNDQITGLTGMWYENKEAYENITPFEGSMKGGTSYLAHVAVDPAFGYLFDEELTAADLVITGADAGSIEYDYTGITYSALFFTVTAEHDWGDEVIDPEPNCTTPGTKTIPCKHNGESWHGDDAILSTEEVAVDPNAHDWGEPSYVWADDNSTVTATRICTRDNDHVDSETVNTTSVVTKEPTATEAGTRTYTATFTKDGFGTVTKDVDITKLPVKLTLVGSSIDGEDVAEDFEVEVAPGSSVSDIPRGVRDEIIAHFTVGDYFPYNNLFYVMRKPLSEFSSLQEIWDEDDVAYDMELTEDTTLYLALAKRVDTVEFTIQPPVCGSKVVFEWFEILENEPVFSGNNDQIELPGGLWVDMETGDYFDGMIVGGSPYTATVYVEPIFGYAFDKDEKKLPTITVHGVDEGGVEVETVFGNTIWLYCSVTANHDWGEWAETKAPTCTEPGMKTIACNFNGKDWHGEDATKTEDVDALGHDWGEWVVTKEPTETEEGEETRTCARCGETETRPIDKLVPSDDTPSGDDISSDDDTPAAISYRNTDGDGNVWTKGSGVTSDFVFKRSENDNETFDHFMGIQVDGNDVDEENYTAEAGSVIVKLKPDYLETLALGAHTITALFEDGNSASAHFTIVAKKTTPSPTPSPTSKASSGTTPTKQTTPSVAGKTANTGDSAPLAPLCVLALLSVAAAIGARTRIA